MATAITHHRFSSPIWGAREVRKLQAELAEITNDAAEILHEHQAAVSKPRPAPQWRGNHGRPGTLKPPMVRPLTNQDTPKETTAIASTMNSNGQRALTDAGSRFDRTASITQDKIVMPLAR